MNPTKIRSKTFVLIYKKSLNKESLISFLKEILRIVNDNQWRYVVKEERYRNGDVYTIVYCNLAVRPTFLASRVSFNSDSQRITPDIHVWNSEHLLRYVLTFCGKFDASKIYTNYDEHTILENVIELKHCTDSGISNNEEIFRNKTIGVDENKTLDLNMKDDKATRDTQEKITRFMKEKQVARFMNHYNALIELSSSSKEDDLLDEMKLKLNNMINFKNNYQLTDEQESLINKGRDLLKSIKKKNTS